MKTEMASPLPEEIGIRLEIDESRLVTDYEDLPQPVGWRILVQPLPVHQKSTGGILLTDATQKANEVLQYCGKVLALGPQCFKHERFMDGTWCNVGDFILFRSHAGHPIQFHRDSKTVVDLIVINDNEIMATTDSPTKLRAMI
jgi:co-chaperonin GroES (HSP10)